MSKCELTIIFGLILCLYWEDMTASLDSEFFDTIPSVDSLQLSSYQKTTDADSVSSSIEKASVEPLVIHPTAGEATNFGKGKQIQLMGKIHNFPGDLSAYRDIDICSPKSVNIHPNASKFYVNSLEGGKTIVYSLPEFNKLKIINHIFDESHSHLWNAPSGLFKFRHYSDRLNCFMGKPVESAFSHGGHYLWIPYYRRSYDINAQDPSAIAVIDTSADTIIRIMEAGVLPKMIAVSPEGTKIAVAHWGDNTVGIIDIKSTQPSDWRYEANVSVGHQLFHDFSLTVPVDRDKNTGEALRGTVFTPDGKYVLVGCMSGGGIAVIDVKRHCYLGKLFGMKPNIRHLVIKGEWLYASINVTGYVQRVKISEVMDGIDRFDESRHVMITGWETVKVGQGARTLELTPRGDYAFVACNFDSKICIVDSLMRKVGEITADSYPVGLDISPDGQWLISTSQGRKNKGGNCVDIYRLTGIEPIEISNKITYERNQDILSGNTGYPEGENDALGDNGKLWRLRILLTLLFGFLYVIFSL